MKKPMSLLGRFLVWRLKHISNKNFILMLSILAGLIGGFLASLIKIAIHYSRALLTHGFNAEYANYLYFAYPIIGITITVLMIRLFYRKEFDHGITNILNSISKKNSIIGIKETFFFLFGSFTTVSLGGSVGMEAPLVMSGSGIGSNIARIMRLSSMSRKLLLGCGAAAALSAFFNAPIAGVIFALEVLMLDLTMASLVPLLMASVIGAIISRYMLGDNIILNFTINDAFLVTDVPFFVLLGIFCGFMSIYFSRIDNFVGVQFRRIKRPVIRTVIGAALIGILVFMFPPLYGEGYSTLRAIIADNTLEILNNTIFYDLRDTGHFLLIFIGMMILLKAFAVSITLNAGGIGGFFAPSLFLGGLCGFLFAGIVNNINPSFNLSEINFTLVGMAGLMSGIFHAPLTAIFLIAEITKGYELIVPLMLVTIISYLIVIYFEPHSVFTRRLARKGELITHHKDKAVMTMLKLEKIIEKDLLIVSPDDSLGDLLKNAVSKSSRNIFPVVDDDHKLLGVILLDDIRSIMFKQDMYDDVFVRDLSALPPAIIKMGDNMVSVIQKFDDTGAWNLPVIDDNENYIGFVSKSKLFTAYRSLLVQFSDE